MASGGRSAAGGSAASSTAQPWPAWFEATQPAVMGNRVLREVLLPHSAEAWPKLVKQLALLGALCARAELGAGRTLTVADLKALSQRVHTELALGATLPGMVAQVESLEGEMAGFLRELNLNEQQPRAGSRPQPASATRPGTSVSTSSSSKATTAGNNKANNSRPVASRSIYPDWWPADGSSSAGRGGRPPGTHEQQQRRPPPRLAYSRQPPPPEAPVHQDDVVTPEWLMVHAKVAVAQTSTPGKKANTGRQRVAGHAPAPASSRSEARVRLVHQQRLALQSQAFLEEPEQRGSRRGLPQENQGQHSSSCGDDGCPGLTPCQGMCGTQASAAEQQQEQEEEQQIDIQTLAKWRRHFGLSL